MKHSKHKFNHTIGREHEVFLKEFNALRALKNCNRLSGLELIKPPSVAIHCYYSGILFELLAKLENIGIVPKDIVLVYRHDILESVTGDMLHPAKHFNESIKIMWERIEQILLESKQFNFLSIFSDSPESFSSELAFELFKIADILELYIYSCEEMALGNMSNGIQVVLNNCFDFLHANCKKYDSLNSFIAKYHSPRRYIKL